MPTSSSGLTTRCTPTTTPPPRSMSPCRGETAWHRDVSQPSSCMVQGGAGCMESLPNPGHGTEAELLTAPPQVPGARNHVPWQHVGNTEVHRLHQH